MTDPTPQRPGLGPILLTVFIDLLGFGLVIPLLSFYAETFDATPQQVTWLMAIYSLAQFVGAPLWGSLSDRVGRRPVMLSSIFFTALFLALFASATQLWQLFVFRALHGVAAANISTAQAYVADITDGKDRAKGMGLIGAAFGVGFTVGPALGGVLGHYVSPAAPIWVAAALSAVNLVWAWARLPESRTAAVRSGGPSRTLSPAVIFHALSHPAAGPLILLFASTTFSFSMMESTFALVGEHRWAMSALDVGGVFFLIGMVGIVIQGRLIGGLVARFGESRLTMLGYASMAVGMGLLASVGPVSGPWSLGAAGIWLGALFISCGTSLTTPSMNSLISRSAGEHEQGTILGVSQSLSALARAVGPATGGFLYTRWVQTGSFVAASVLMGVACLVSIPATRRAIAARAAAQAK